MTTDAVTVLPHGKAGSTVNVKFRYVAAVPEQTVPKFCGPEGLSTPPVACNVPVNAEVVQTCPGPPVFCAPKETVTISPGSSTPFAPAEPTEEPPEFRMLVGVFRQRRAWL